MSQSLSNVIVHLVFSTENGKRFLRELALRDEMWKMLGGASKSLDCPTLIVGGTEDHIHLLGRQSRKIAMADWVKELKRTTSVWGKKRDPQLATFQWQTGYGAFSVSQSSVAQVVEYRKNQEEHHRRFDFQSEYRKLLERHGIEFDERYVWD
jgi:putative transposase